MAKAEPTKALELVVDNATGTTRPAGTPRARKPAPARDQAAPPPVYADPPDLSGHMTVAMAAHRVLRACFLHLLNNRLPVLKGDDPEGVHQARVALRRLRAGISLFREVLRGPEISHLAAEAKWLSGELGPVRDCDVFIGEILEPVAEACGDAPGIADYRGVLLAMQRERLERARAAFRSRRFTQWRQGFQGWLARDIAPPLAVAPTDALVAAQYRPIRVFAAGVLAKRDRHVRRRGRHVMRLQAGERHELRLAIKKLRYATEFFGSVFETSTAKAYSKRLARVQSILGYLNDIAAAGPLMQKVETALAERKAATADAMHVSGLILGWHGALGRRADDRLRKEWRRFAETEPFWK